MKDIIERIMHDAFLSWLVGIVSFALLQGVAVFMVVYVGIKLFKGQTPEVKRLARRWGWFASSASIVAVLAVSFYRLFTMG